MKKVLVFFVTMTAILAMFAIGASAAECYVEDFSVEPPEGKVKNYPNWSPYTEDAEAGVTWDEGCIKIEKTADTKPIWNVSSGASDNVHFFMFDMKQNDVAAKVNFSGYFFTPGGRAIFYLKNPTADEWYTYLFASQYEIIDGEEKLCISVFRKLSDDEEWVKFSGPTAVDVKSMGSRLNLNFSGAENGAITWFDNMKSHEGLYYEKIAVTDGEGNELSLENGVPEDVSEIKVTANIYNANSISSTMLTEPKVIPVLAMVTLFDQKGMMIDCATARSELTYFENRVEVNLPLDGIDAENIAKVDLYVLNNIEDMLTVMAPTTLN